MALSTLVFFLPHITRTWNGRTQKLENPMGRHPKKNKTKEHNPTKKPFVLKPKKKKKKKPKNKTKKPKERGSTAKLKTFK